jgi:hypothetical protein
MTLWSVVVIHLMKVWPGSSFRRVATRSPVEYSSVDPPAIVGVEVVAAISSSSR